METVMNINLYYEPDLLNCPAKVLILPKAHDIQ